MDEKKFAIEPAYINIYGLNNIKTLKELKELLINVHSSIPNTMFYYTIKKDLNNLINKIKED